VNSIGKFLLFIAIGIVSVPVAHAQPATWASAQQLETSCARGDGVNCYYLGEMYQTGKGVKLDKSKAAEYYSKAVELYTKECNGGVELGCINLGDMYARGLGVRKDRNRAMELLRKLCDAKEDQGVRDIACRELARVKKGSG